MKNLEEIISKIGLSEKETALYLAALNLGEAPMARLARQSKLKRTTAYQIFRELEKRGIMGSFKTRNGLKFTAAKPDNIFSLRQKELTDFASALPELRAFEQKGKDKPKVSYYEGADGCRLAIEDSLKKPGNILRHIGSITESHKTLDEKYDLDYYLPTRVKHNISIKCLYFPDTKKHIKNRNHTQELREIKYLPENFLFKGSSLIYDDKVIILSGTEEMMTVVIESKSIAEAEKQKFDLIWSLVE